VLSDLKAAEWRYLQAALNSTAPTDQELLQQLHKRRKTSVTITTAPNTPITPDNTSTTSSATSARVFCYQRAHLIVGRPEAR